MLSLQNDIFKIAMPSSAKYSASELPLLDLSDVSRAVQKEEVSPIVFSAPLSFGATLF
jgi:hypothetical protein